MPNSWKRMWCSTTWIARTMIGFSVGAIVSLGADILVHAKIFWQ